jgi:two-component system OmpR family response regulator
MTTTTPPAVLLVDDDEELLDLLKEYLRTDGFIVNTAYDGEQTLSTLENMEHDVVVLDIMMPGLSGLDVLKAIRLRWNTPVIMLTGRGDDVDKIVGLELGADDYLSKPCNPRELSARLRAVLRRSQAHPSPATTPSVINIDTLCVDGTKLVASVNSHALPLTGTEFKALQLLCAHAGETLSRDYLTETVLQRNFGPYDRSMDVHISRLRTKLAQFPELNINIKSLRGMGYQLTVSESHK